MGTYSQINKGHFPVRLESHSLRGIGVATREGLWLLTKYNQMYCSQKPRQEPQGSCALPYITPYLYVSIKTVTSSNDVMIICSSLQAGKPLCMHSSIVPRHLHICWHPWPVIFNSYPQTVLQIPKPNFYACDTHPQVFWCTLILESKIY